MPGNEDQPAKGDIEPAVSEPEAEPDTAEVEVLPPELAQQIPPAVRKKVSAFFMHASSMVDPLAAKVTSEHISKSIDLAQDNANKNFDYAKGGRWYQFVVFLIAVAVAIFLIVYLVEKEKPEYLSPLLAGFLGFAGGFGIGRRSKWTLAIHFMYYNFGRRHMTLKTTPAVAAGVTDHEWFLDEIVGLLIAA